MKERAFLCRTLGFSVCLMVLFGVAVFALPPAEVQAKQVVIKVVGAWPPPVWTMGVHRQYLERVEKRSKGRIKFNYVGGPEAIPTFQQGEAVRTGAVDMVLGAINYYSDAMPEVIALKLFYDPPWVWRKNGVFDYLNELHAKKMNMYYLGDTIPHLADFSLFTVKPVKDLADLKGRSIRVTPIYKDFIEALGIAPVNIAPSEVYTALQRGIVDGVCWGTVGIIDLKWHEKCKYRIEPSFYNMEGNCSINLDKWKSLTPEDRELMEDVMKDHERIICGEYAYWVKERKEKQAREGVQVIKLNPEDAKKFLDTAYNVGWDTLIREKKIPEVIKFKELIDAYHKKMQ